MTDLIVTRRSSSEDYDILISGAGSGDPTPLQAIRQPFSEDYLLCDADRKYNALFTRKPFSEDYICGDIDLNRLPNSEQCSLYYLNSLLHSSENGIIKNFNYSLLPFILGNRQNYRTFAEVDNPSKVTVVENTITLALGDRDETYHVSKQYPLNYFKDFIIWLDLKITQITNTSGSTMFLFAVANSANDLNAIDTANGSFITIEATRVDATHFKLGIGNCNAGTISYTLGSNSIALNTTIYISILRNTQSGGVLINAFSTPLKRIISNGGDGDVEFKIKGGMVGSYFNFLYGLACVNDASTARDISGTISNLIEFGFSF